MFKYCRMMLKLTGIKLYLIVSIIHSFIEHTRISSNINILNKNCNSNKSTIARVSFLFNEHLALVENSQLS